MNNEPHIFVDDVNPMEDTFKSKLTQEVKYMATLGEAADSYKPSAKTMNIADLDRVSIDLQVEVDTFEFTKNGETKTVEQEVIVIDEVKYRVPVTVKQQLKVLMDDNPEMNFFKVKKSGTNKDDTRYQVIPLMK